MSDMYVWRIRTNDVQFQISENWTVHAVHTCVLSYVAYKPGNCYSIWQPHWELLFGLNSSLRYKPGSILTVNSTAVTFLASVFVHKTRWSTRLPQMWTQLWIKAIKLDVPWYYRSRSPCSSKWEHGFIYRYWFYYTNGKKPKPNFSLTFCNFAHCKLLCGSIITTINVGRGIFEPVKLLFIVFQRVFAFAVHLQCIPVWFCKCHCHHDPLHVSAMVWTNHPQWVAFPPYTVL